MIRRFGHDIIEHTLQLPWDHFAPVPGETIEVFAREIRPSGGAELPVVVYLQGGPGFPAPRPTAADGVIGEFLKTHRVLLLDQRGTGRSNRIDQHSKVSSRQLALLRADQICADAEAFREHLGLKRWDLFGQSFGGFCITAYLSRYPSSVGRAFLTGGLPAVGVDIDDIYRATYRALQRRHDAFYHQIPFAESRIREVCAHLDTTAEVLPTGERLTSRRFRTIGIELGRGHGFDTLAYLLEEPFRTLRGEKRLRSDFLAEVGRRVSFADGPLYATIHESIYAYPGAATRWSAHRIREEIPGFEEDAAPQTADKFYLTGEHIFPWQFDEDPALHGLSEAAKELAERTDFPELYSPSGLASAETVAAAAIYADDIFVPFGYSRNTAEMYRDLRPYLTNLFQHDGIRHDGAGIVRTLKGLIDDH
ncbi:alpha/beta fold hydrolase [Corynebacterium epidermidicanis]|uniref:Alpha/beta hydrolase family protein n=1 Tax=Corynebacterium epidermidicanis TaxID=1050174 RepID=A0A0G3GXX0_9CORY|nr:alpha/beta fold hydrolase [Corynebacterium epidermidicanis]AKK03662.1 alpha/beta hydrolase family protein [Corynebacterium epidermidicanis]